MMVAYSFDLWQKDAFFSAAEEVQESADIMESSYRLWIREKREGRAQEILDELVKELRAALSTAKWQLEQFEKAVRLGHEHRHTTSSRHKQFIAAIEDQISRVESALDKTYSDEGKQRFHWVNLNIEESDDLAMFLSGALETSSSATSTEDSRGRTKAELNSKASSSRDNLSKITSHDNDSDCVIDIEEKKSPKSGDDGKSQNDQTFGARKTCSSQSSVTLRIEKTCEEGREEQKSGLLAGINIIHKEKGHESLFRLQRSREYNQSNEPISVRNQLFGRDGDRQRQLIRLRLPSSRSIKLTLALMLMIFLILPYVLYST